MHDLKIFTDYVEPTALEQINKLLEQPSFMNSKIRIMPDVCAGKSCVIGFTGDLGDKVIPSIVGVDIGCGMFCANIGNIDIDLKKLDEFICKYIPSGTSINDSPIIDFDLTKLYCYESLKNPNLLKCAIGSLGGGNHFIEVDKSNDGEKYLVIHSGSRNLGVQVANYYQRLANKLCNTNTFQIDELKKKIIHDYKLAGRDSEIQLAISQIKSDYQSKCDNTIPYEFTYLEGKYRDMYLHDMLICQKYAIINRYMIAKKIADYMGWSLNDFFESIHNYISLEDNIVRKGAISAKEGERLIIPINMRDGCIIGVGKGNSDWNYSAPHGAGRIMSRSKAKNSIKLDDYVKSMNGIYTSSVNEGTIDEAPFAYKSIDEIIKNIYPTVEITKIVKPIYNFKANELDVLDEIKDESNKTK